MRRSKLAWAYRGALARYFLSEITFTARQPPPLTEDTHMWAPYFIRRGRLVWVDMQGEHFNTPFARGAFMRRLHHSKIQIRITRIEALESIGEVENSIPLSGFVFHISRCGSTLLRNILGEVSGNLSLGEPSLLTPVLAGAPLPSVQAQLRGGIQALGRSFAGQEKRLFVKLESLHMDKLDLFEETFPDVPRVFIYRDPMEIFEKVVLSGSCGWMAMKKNPRMASRFTGLDPSLIQSLSVDEYAARTIGRYYEMAAERSSYGLALFNYRNLTERNGLRRVLEFFGIGIGDEELDRILAVTKNNAKRPVQTYSARSAVQLSTAQRNLVEKWAVEPYEKLEFISEPPLIEPPLPLSTTIDGSRSKNLRQPSTLA